MGNNLVQHILQAEEALKIAMQKSDIAALDSLLSDQLIFTNHLGQRLSKNDDLDLHRSGLLNINSIDLYNLDLITQQETCVVHTFASITGTYSGQNADGHFAFSRVWAKHGDKWQVISAQSTLLAQKDINN
ncbi:nuclear transport factor 2 family protein [Pseudoalteromonas obscura]|uniref:Nuclear transport factor 2 family protein n=1 Tax=Pseudoalteromonas obscura TaxID=3048491 RepID=A0ABT7EGG3_9GAMM|nr:nuclear transport factor 2 family protein [Pseudoalteromonas sp. P94(2023)]MDK2594134.1 nuclear transport factor 2 family protein [Pseudoalteromonas sp. P94(2023)]